MTPWLGAPSVTGENRFVRYLKDRFWRLLVANIASWRKRPRLRTALSARAGQLAACVCLLWASGASAFYVGDSFLSIPGSAGHWKGSDYKNWIRAQANDWSGVLRRVSTAPGDFLTGDKLYFGGPGASKPGGTGKLVLSLDKSNPDLNQLMDKCTHKTTIPEALYAESSDRSRPPMELGPRPAQFPSYWEYKLKNVQIVDCPVVADASAQAFVFTFEDIEWLNSDPNGPRGTKIVLAPKDIPDVKPIEPSAKTKTKAFVITWIAPNTDSTEQQCPVMNSKPTDADFFRFLSPEEIAAEQAKNGEKGVVAGMQSEMRGPHKLNAVLLPGIVPDPGFHEPNATVVDGINLDGDDGKGAPPRGVCGHTNFVSPDGRTGIDNQYYRVSACIPGFRGKQGYRNQTSNARRADGNTTTLIEISGIHDEKNGKHVNVAIIFSKDKPMRDASGKFVPNYTFRTTDNPNFTLYNVRLHASIVNGIVITEPVKRLLLNLGQDPQLELFDARLRFEILPDGSLKGLLAGYRDWRAIVTNSASGYSEGLFSYQVPGLYNSLKRNADGLKNPLTGECDGISMAYEIDAVPAFLVPGESTATQVAQDPAVEGKSP
jgi:hypothetical protein